MISSRCIKRIKLEKQNYKVCEESTEKLHWQLWDCEGLLRHKSKNPKGQMLDLDYKIQAFVGQKTSSRAMIDNINWKETEGKEPRRPENPEQCDRGRQWALGKPPSGCVLVDRGAERGGNAMEGTTGRTRPDQGVRGSLTALEGQGFAGPRWAAWSSWTALFWSEWFQ